MPSPILYIKIKNRANNLFVMVLKVVSDIRVVRDEDASARRKANDDELNVTTCQVVIRLLTIP